MEERPMRSRVNGAEGQGRGLGTGSLAGFDLHRFEREVAQELGVGKADVNEKAVRAYEERTHSRRSR